MNNQPKLEFKYENHFARKQFVTHLINKHKLKMIYPIITLDNIVLYGLEHKNASRNQLAYFLFDLIPELEFKEVAAFCEDDILTVNAQYEKDDYIKNVLANEDLHEPTVKDLLSL